MILQTVPPKKVLLGGQSLGIFTQTNINPPIGTLTFIEPVLYRYGALGHLLPTNWFTDLKKLGVRSSIIKTIKKPRNNILGSKIGTLNDFGLSGTIKRNTRHGIFGDIRGVIPNPYFKDPIPVGNFEDLSIGPATFYTVIENEIVEEFNINIDSIKITRKKIQYLTISINDSSLIQRAGGIVKGMSGSPIVQNGKLIGAISHLSAANNLNGYGIFIGDMLNDLEWKERPFSLQSVRKLFSYPLSLRES